MSWWQKIAAIVVLIGIGLYGAYSAQAAVQDQSPMQNIRTPVTFGAATPQQISVAVPDPLDVALERAGMRRSDLGVSPRGWWSRYPRSNLHKLDHFDDLFREPLASVPFTRTLGKSVREYLGPAGLAMAGTEGMEPAGGYAITRLLYTAIGLRWYPGIFATFLPNLKLTPEEVALDEAILALYRYAGEPTRYASYEKELYYPNVEQEVKHRVTQLSPEVSRILGRFLIDVVEAHRYAALGFRDVTLEQRLQIGARIDLSNLNAYFGLEYANLHVLDDVAKEWDEGSVWVAAHIVVKALEDARRALKALPRSTLEPTASFDWRTPLGWIRIRGTHSDNIDATDSLLIVDLGGDDHWSGPVGASSPTQLLGLALDLAGNDTYEGDGATQGAGIAGIGILLDAAGNDRYSAEYYAQGIGQFGLGALIDLEGNDIYRAGHSAQGAAFFNGVGLLADAGGDDEYEVVASGQGFGGPGSVGILADRMGNDIYRAEPDAQKSGRPSYATKSSASSAQGFGVGWNAGRAKGHSWAGGLGALIDIEGADRYIAGDWSQGTGYWFGTGLLYDGIGNDHYEGGLKWSQATAAHFAIGVLLDEGGDDVNIVHGAGLGVAHDVSVALFVAIGGNDHYKILEDGLGCSFARSPLGLFVDIGGNDVYEGKSGARPGLAPYNFAFAGDYDGTGNVTEIGNRGFPALAYMSSLALFLDVGGKDTYWGGLANGAIWGDEPGSDNWKVRNVGIGVDVPDGSIDWRPLPLAGKP